MAPSTPPTVLVVEDHELTRRFLVDNLSADGFRTHETATLSEARRCIVAGDTTLAVLDLGLPDGDGLSLVDELRGTDDGRDGLDPRLPLLVLSGRSSEIDRVRGLARGADDYLVKPFGYSELRARIDALLRRSSAYARHSRTRVATLEVDPLSRTVTLEGAPIHLSKKEFALLAMLASDPTRTFTRDELLREVWGFRSRGVTRTLDTHAHRLRRKLGTGRVAFVVNVWGVGYRLWDGGA